METPCVVRAVLSALVGSWLCTAGTFPLPFPVRPTSFPLKRPTVTGTVVAWGNNNSGQTLPQLGLKGVVAITAGSTTTFALRSDGTVVGWGSSDPVLTGMPAGIQGRTVAISAGNEHALALLSDGTVVAWGVNDSGDSTVPSGLSSVVAVSAGDGISLALKADGTVVAWGVNSSGQATVPKGLGNVVAISAGRLASLALVADGAIDGRVAGWPMDWAGVPGGLSGVVAIAEGKYFASIPAAGDAIALRSDGTVQEFNPNWFGSTPQTLKNVVASARGYSHSIALRDDGTVIAWGITGPSNEPPAGLTNVVAIAAGYYHSVALVSDGLSLPPGATARAQVVNGFVVGLDVLNGGRGYAVPPLVVIRGGGGSGATATAILRDGAVVGFKITNPGSDYTSPPTVLVASPPFAPELSVAVSRVSVSMKVVLGKSYQIQASSDSANWAAVGGAFVADSETLTQEFAVADTGRFFRVVEIQ